MYIYIYIHLFTTYIYIYIYFKVFGVKRLLGRKWTSPDLAEDLLRLPFRAPGAELGLGRSRRLCFCLFVFLIVV